MPDLNIRVLSNITKDYPDMIKIVIFKEPRYFVHSDFVRKRDKVADEFYSPKSSSIKRTKTMIKDLVICNDFQLFCTFTFNPDKVDSFSLPRCWSVMSSWLHNQRNKSREQGIEFKYLIIPEKHKSGRYHFHALISGYIGSLKDSNIRTASLRKIYNITSFRSGFTTAVYIDDKYSVSNYVTKYITKDTLKSFNQRRYFASRNLIRPIKQLNSDLFFHIPPLFRKKTFESFDSTEYVIDKCFLN